MFALTIARAEPTAEDPWSCTDKCNFFESDEEWNDAQKVCDLFKSWTSPTGCALMCPPEIVKEIHTMQGDACSGDWEIPSEHEREETEEALAEAEEDVEDEGFPMCLDDCLPAGFDYMNENSVCNALSGWTSCMDDCDQEVRDVVHALEQLACSDDETWPPEEETSELEVMMPQHGLENGRDCMQQCVQPCFIPTFTACEARLYGDCFYKHVDNCAEPESEDCTEKADEMCEFVSEECEKDSLAICAPQCLTECGLHFPEPQA